LLFVNLHSKPSAERRVADEFNSPKKKKGVRIAADTLVFLQPAFDSKENGFCCEEHDVVFLARIELCAEGEANGPTGGCQVAIGVL
jgi:hypothetical protein